MKHFDHFTHLMDYRKKFVGVEEENSRGLKASTNPGI